LTALAVAALSANVDPRVVELILGALGLGYLGKGVATLLTRLTEGLIVLLLLAAYVEQWPFRKLEHRLHLLRADVDSQLTAVHKDLAAQLQVLQVDHLKDHEIRRQLRDALEERYPGRLGNMLDLVLPEALAPISKAQIIIRLRTPDGLTGSYVYHYLGQFSIRQNDYIIGIVTSKGHVDTLLDANAPLDDVFVLSRPDSTPDLSVDQIVHRYQIKLQYLDQGTRSWLDTRPSPINDMSRIWTSVSPADRFPLTLLRLTIPYDPSIRERLVRWTYQLPLSIEDGFSFWEASRPTFVDHIVMDASQLRGITDLKFERFLPNFYRMGTQDENAGRVFTVNVQNWVLKGHGVILSWQKESEQTV
jgi:hypothetical protein